ncbi:hypothetical protein WR25_25160 [Diploscapter pachys]|uniref:Proline-rich protein PRCC n=1 Tax=Diploscapter pachys TaxID=2018661 RepID=A0A2A2LVU4_9BILA|nr:hypothetical protein WR25_25160 [Diploscapter pachys]
MNSLVDYGSGSDSESDEELQKQPIKAEAGKQPKQVANDNSQLGLDDEEMEDYEWGETDTQRDKGGRQAEDALEEIVKPKEWERKLAEKTRKKLKKKAKKERKEKKAAEVKTVSAGGITKPKPRAVISAFGALGKIASKDGQVLPSASSSSGFLSFLPPPKSKSKSVKGGLIVPPSVAKKAASNTAVAASTINKPNKPTISAVPLPSKEGDDSDDEEGDSEDFFGLSKSNDLPNLGHYQIPTMPLDGRFEEVGPSRPAQAEVHPSQMYNNAQLAEYAGPSTGKVKGLITDEEAHRLIMQHAHDIGEGEGRSYNEMVQDLVEVNVRDALGPNVKANLLKNLTHKALAESKAAPLPAVQATADPNARRKHQITYLAKMAVDHDAALQEKWADAKNNKRMARQKYGF